MTTERYHEAVRAHIRTFFAGRPIDFRQVNGGPIGTSLPGFQVAVVAPGRVEPGWVYVTVGASDVALPWTGSPEGHEFLITSEHDSDEHVLSLAMVSNFHADPKYEPVGLGRILDIGRPWIPGSACCQFLVSLPYMQGPKFEVLHGNGFHVRFLWLLPITPSEAKFVRDRGVESFEERLEAARAAVTRPDRPSVV